LKIIAGHGVRRGRLPGATLLACPSTAQDWDPRVETTRPVPGTTGACVQPSLGVAENTLPARSTTHRYEVSSRSVPAGSIAGGRPRHGTAALLPRRGAPAGGIPDWALSGWISSHRSFAYSEESSASIGTSTNSGSP